VPARLWLTVSLLAPLTACKREKEASAKSGERKPRFFRTAFPLTTILPVGVKEYVGAVYDAATLAPRLAKAITPNGTGGGIWQSGSGPSADASGNLYLTVGNGTVSAPSGGTDYGDAFLKLDPLGKVLDWFIPYDFEMLNQFDMDLGSAGVLLIPNSRLLTSGGKNGVLYILDRNKFGHFRADSNGQIIQRIKVSSDGMYSTPTYWNGPGGPYLYTWGSMDRGKAFRVHDGLVTPDPVSQTTMMVPGMPGGILAISAANEAPATGILWVSHGVMNANEETVRGVLRAFDAMDLSHELWNSLQNPERDDVGAFSKFNTPVVANGRVYVATFSKQISVYGLLSDGAGPRSPVAAAGARTR
jgi:hypothetical protein